MRFVKSTIANRADLPRLLSTDDPDKHQAVEVGVYLGEFSYELLRTYRGTLYLVDPWNSPNCEGSLVGGEQHYQEVVKKFKDNHQVQLIRQYSQEAVVLFQDESLEMVYLDAEHTYDGVTGDIHLWWPKVKPGGILSGHDILFYDHIGVTQAIIDSYISDICFVTRGECDPKTGHLYSASSWYMVKQ